MDLSLTEFGARSAVPLLACQAVITVMVMYTSQF